MQSLRGGFSSLILIADDEASLEKPSLTDLRERACNKGIYVVTVPSKEELGVAFGKDSLSVVSLNGGPAHVNVVWSAVNESMPTPPAGPAA